MGTGTPADPHALRFDGRTSYAEGTGSLELPELTLEVWASIEGASNHESKGVNRRGATLIGNDLGGGGISLLIQPTSGSPLLLHGKTFSPVAAETPLWTWQQVVVAVKTGVATGLHQRRVSGLATGPARAAEGPRSRLLAGRCPGTGE